LREDLHPARARVVLRPKKRKEALLVVLCLVLAFISALAGASGSFIGWLGFAFFALAAVVIAVNLVPGASYLRLEPSGFLVCSLFRADRLWGWDEVTGFRVYDLPGGTRQVGFDFAPGAEPAGSRLASRLAGVQGALPNTYGLKAEELADLMNRWREEHASGRGPSRATPA
jgi:hypothetical protein